MRKNDRYNIAAFAVVSFLCLSCPSAQAVVEEEQIKLDAASPAVFREIEKLSSLLTYRLKPIGEYFYQDYYYDTPEHDLFRLGYAFRFRIRDKNSGEKEYGIQFKKEYDPSNRQDFRRKEIDDIIPSWIARRILSGEWSEAFSNDYEFRTTQELRKFLAENKVDAGRLAPVLYGKQTRSRFSLKEKKILYFEISMDQCLFTDLISTKKKEFQFCQLEFENKFKGERELMDLRNKRIQKVISFFTKKYSMTVTPDSKYRKMVKKFFIQNPESGR